MGQGQSATAGKPESGAKGFGVRMTPAVMEQANPGRQDTTAASNQALQLAFQQGVDHAREEMATGQDAATRQQRLEELEHLNQEQARLLHERTEELQKREYRAPVTTLACKEERQAALACFRESKGNAPGEIVLKCQQVTDDLDRCAALVREAAVSKIVSGSLKA